MRTVGVVVNPIAGMGGRVGLKGTDGKVAEARERGAERRAPARARRALDRLHELAPDTRLLAWGGPMGADAAGAAGFEPEVLGEPAGRDAPDGTDTGAGDTRAAVAAFLDAGVDLVLFVGGDGTAVDVAETVADRGGATPILGVPAGVKVYSGVFAVTPEDAARVVADYERTEDREVNDIDEDTYRGEGEVHTELRAVAAVPVAEELQSSKQVGGGGVDTLAAGVAADVTAGTTYVLGPGSTVGAVKEALGFEGSPLGVDVWRATSDGPDPTGELLVTDGGEAEILAALGEDNVVVVSPIGGQGFVFGRGNHQISPAVLERSAVAVVAAREKLDDIGTLRVDIDDPTVEGRLRGWQKVRVGRFETRMMKLV